MQLTLEANYYVHVFPKNNLMIEVGVGMCTRLQPLFKGFLHGEFVSIYIGPTIFSLF